MKLLMAVLIVVALSVGAYHAWADGGDDVKMCPFKWCMPLPADGGD